MRNLIVLLCLCGSGVAALPGQEPAPAPPVESVRVDSVRPSPTPAQLSYIQGVRTVARGVAQLRDGINRVSRTQAGSDTLRQRQAGRRLGGLCTAARGFIASGRPQMQAAAYVDSMQILARRLAVRVDSILTFIPTCERNAGKTPRPIADGLLLRLRNYESALQAFRAAMGPPNR